MQRFVSWVGPWLIATALVAQQGPPDSKPAVPATAAERIAALKAEQKKLIEDWQQQMREAAKKPKEATAAGKPVAAISMRPDFAPLVVKAKEGAAAFAGTDDAVPFLLFVVQNGGNKDDMVEALDTLTSKHVDHAGLAELGQMIAFLPRIVPADKAATFTERLGKSANADVRAWTLLAKHQETIEKADRDGDAYKTAKAELQKAAGLAADARLKGEIQSAIDTREKFGMGNTAPDIEGKDLDGVAFKLSDYKGKVVFLDFWGDW